MPRGEAPKFSDTDKSYSMTAPASIELVRMRECRKMTMDLIELMRVQGWLLENSSAVEQMELAWAGLWNEYVSIFEAQYEDDEKNNLFKYRELDYRSISHLFKRRNNK